MIGPQASFCKWCRYNIPKNAIVCTKCDKHQSRFFEYSKMLITVAGVLGIIASAVNYVWDDIVEFSAIFQEPKIEVTSFHTERSIRVSTGYNSKIFLERYNAGVNGQKSSVFGVLNLELRNDRVVSFETKSRGMKAKEDKGFFLYLRKIKTPELVHLTKYELGRIVYLSVDDPDFQSILENEGGVDDFVKAECSVTFLAQYQNKSITSPVNCRALGGAIGQGRTNAWKNYYNWKSRKVP